MSTENIICYNIHNILKIKTNFKWGKLPAYFKVDAVAKPELNIKEGKFDVDFDSLKPLGLRMFKGDNFLIHKPYLYGDLKFKVENLDRGVTNVWFTKGYKRLYNFYGGTVGPHILSQTLSSIILIKILQKGYTIVHSACVSKDSKGVLISAWGETGKTLTSSTLVQQDSFQFLSDDLTIIDADGVAYSFPQTLEKRGFQPFEKIPFLNRIRISKRTDVSKIRIIGKTKIRNLFFLEKEEGDVVREIDEDEAFKRLMLSTASTLNLNANEAILAYSYLDKNMKLRDYTMWHEEIIKDMLKGVKCFEVKSRDAERFAGLIKESVG